MNFSEVFKQSNQLCKVSPDGKYLATCVQYRLVVRDVSTLQILQLYTCLDQITHMEWSSDSQFIMCAMYKRGLVQVWSLEQPDWHCKIDEGSIGLLASRWSPDGRHILNTTEFHLRITVWSLCTKAVSYIKYPKACYKGIDFSRDGCYMALAERRDCKDYICVFVCDDWHLLRHFETETQDLAGLEWSPNGCVLAVWDSCLEYKVLLYSLDGRLLSTFSAYEWSLGVKAVAWSPSSQFLAIGSYDEKVRILNHITWKKIALFEHPATINNNKVVVYKEVEKRVSAVGPEDLSLHNITMGSSLLSTQSKYEIHPPPVQMPVVRPDPDRANPKIGVSTLAFSSDSRYLATKNDNMSSAVWVWDMQKMSLVAVLEQMSAVRCFQWDPRRSRLALCTGNAKVYLWTPAGCVSVQVPDEAGGFQVQSLTWHCDGDFLILLGKEQLRLCYMDTSPEDK
ncbi:WD repeat-containing protein WRAP73 isoform X1 [Entelurus aequoreus]|uniref:WD repeat-containing protein WRAP73 isoform X1 n=1 Tax=Entelurus aequoreus TaxID=161455 RepID=UPI002B1D23E5|nr:WD repeat-containing protein WRAP73 isoform X1 [Entelurus aequoreus]XP_061910422.1 WD repeat-containing protein WRAP73 isoform X1 [Entelurus aequoreus]XP_061910423.1 WD repeat-containing protein WRAP73 isoform X1 [Entelurus aequoreus]